MAAGLHFSFFIHICTIQSSVIFFSIILSQRFNLLAVFLLVCSLTRKHPAATLKLHLQESRITNCAVNSSPLHLLLPRSMLFPSYLPMSRKGNAPKCRVLPRLVRLKRYSVGCHIHPITMEENYCTSVLWRQIWSHPASRVTNILFLFARCVLVSHMNSDIPGISPAPAFHTLSIHLFFYSVASPS